MRELRADTADTYVTVGSADAEIEVERSRFLCRLRRADSEAAARAVVAEARTEHRQANHHCSAFVIGPDGALRRSSDDGEPAGTAGRPMLEVLAGRGLSDVVAVVTRYFGGVKLGTGGLARAYSDAVVRAIDAAPRVRRAVVVPVTVTVAHADAGRIEHALREDGVAVRDVAYGESATLRLAIPGGESEALGGRLAELGVGADRWHRGSSDWQDVG